ncbi:unnamed protein product [Arabidopsis thaliana]|uniref:Uncharacterized protein n=1 Tax=Arabidopsis thaliana TaxID=3702 RepID=A0A5S9WQW8_ARATH|nr:unnamed protein product [Arabidopsis thaliana]
MKTSGIRGLTYSPNTSSGEFNSAAGSAVSSYGGEENQWHLAARNGSLRRFSRRGPNGATRELSLVVRPSS